MADGTFFEETIALGERVGVGELDGSVTVDQVYSLYQHEGADFNHPRGGEAFYLRRPLYENTGEYLEAFRAVFEDDGPSCAEVMIADTKDLAGAIPVRAPVEFQVLRNSASAKVSDDGIDVYYEPPALPRLTQEQLNAIRHAEEPIVNPAEWLRQWHFHRGEGGDPLKGKLEGL